MGSGCDPGCRCRCKPPFFNVPMEVWICPTQVRGLSFFLIWLILDVPRSDMWQVYNSLCSWLQALFFLFWKWSSLNVENQVLHWNFFFLPCCFVHGLFLSWRGKTRMWFPLVNTTSFTVQAEDAWEVTLRCGRLGNGDLRNPHTARSNLDVSVTLQLWVCSLSRGLFRVEHSETSIVTIPSITYSFPTSRR